MEEVGDVLNIEKWVEVGVILYERKFVFVERLVGDMYKLEWYLILDDYIQLKWIVNVIVVVVV